MLTQNPDDFLKDEIAHLRAQLAASEAKVARYEAVFRQLKTEYESTPFAAITARKIELIVRQALQETAPDE